MKRFTNFQQFTDWSVDLIKQTEKEAIEEVAREEYKDSKKYTYLDTEEMYDSGANSNFAEGEVVLRADQVRWLYYNKGVKPRYNMSAVPQWHEATKRENMKKYKNIYINSFKKKKEK